MELKDIIRIRREHLNLTLEAVARSVGVSAATVSRWESGEIKNLRRDKIAALAEVLEVSPGYLMGWEDSQGMPIPKITKKVKANGDVVTTTRWEVSLPAVDLNAKKAPAETRNSLSKDPDIRRIERARQNMPEKDKERMMKMLVVAFDDYFDESFEDSDINE